jgi:hypothetical protein
VVVSPLGTAVPADRWAGWYSQTPAAVMADVPSTSDGPFQLPPMTTAAAVPSRNSRYGTPPSRVGSPAPSAEDLEVQSFPAQTPFSRPPPVQSPESSPPRGSARYYAALLAETVGTLKETRETLRLVHAAYQARATLPPAAACRTPDGPELPRRMTPPLERLTPVYPAQLTAPPTPVHPAGFTVPTTPVRPARLAALSTPVHLARLDAPSPPVD